MPDPRQPGVLMMVRFKSSLSDEEMEHRYKERLSRFEALPGLMQKYYIHDPSSGEWGGIYLWESRAALDEFLESDLRKSIPDVYEIVGAPRVEMPDVVHVLRPGQ